MKAERVFVVRLWLEPQLDGSGAWRASVLTPVNGARRYFTEPSRLTQFLLDPDWPLEPIDFSPNEHD
jgi:hypothetical protein